MDFSKEEQIIKEALLKRALGYDYEEKIVQANREGKTVSIKLIKKHVPPDVKAIEKIEYLKACGRW